MSLKTFTLLRLIAASLAITLVSCSLVTRSHAPAKIRVEIRLAERTPSPNYQEMELYGTRVKLYVGQEVYFSNSDIKYAKVETSKGTVFKEPMVVLKLTDNNSEKLAKFTKENYYKSVAIIFDGKVMSTPIITGTITNGLIYFTGRFTFEEAKVFAERINGK